jgi:hypothetical protein
MSGIEREIFIGTDVNATPEIATQVRASDYNPLLVASAIIAGFKNLGIFPD